MECPVEDLPATSAARCCDRPDENHSRRYGTRLWQASYYLYVGGLPPRRHGGWVFPPSPLGPPRGKFSGRPKYRTGGAFFAAYGGRGERWHSGALRPEIIHRPRARVGGAAFS